MAVHTIKRLASRLLSAGESRIRITDLTKVRDALTADDVRELIAQGIITVLPKKGVGRGKARKSALATRQGRGRGSGSHKGKASAAGLTDKERWMQQVRAQRKTLKAYQSQMHSSDYRTAYRMVKGNAFRTRKQLIAYLQQHLRKAYLA